MSIHDYLNDAMRETKVIALYDRGADSVQRMEDVEWTGDELLDPSGQDLLEYDTVVIDGDAHLLAAKYKGEGLTSLRVMRPVPKWDAPERDVHRAEEIEQNSSFYNTGLNGYQD